MSSLSYQEDLVRAVLASDARGAGFPDGAPPERWNVYRRMVRGRLSASLEHGFQRLSGVLGEERFSALFDRFLAEAPPRSHYLRDVPGEFLRFFDKNRNELIRAFELPAFAIDLARYEWAELDTEYSFEEIGTGEVGPLDMARIPVLTPAHRLIDIAYPVHRIDAGATDVRLDPEPFSLCVYRDPKTHEIAVLELTPVTAAMLAFMEHRSLPLTEIVRNAAEGVGVTVDVAFVEALSTLLADLIERGVLLGSLVPKETS